MTEKAIGSELLTIHQEFRAALQRRRGNSSHCVRRTHYWRNALPLVYKSRLDVRFRYPLNSQHVIGNELKTLRLAPSKPRVLGDDPASQRHIEFDINLDEAR